MGPCRRRSRPGRRTGTAMPRDRTRPAGRRWFRRPLTGRASAQVATVGGFDPGCDRHVSGKHVEPPDPLFAQRRIYHGRRAGRGNRPGVSTRRACARLSPACGRPRAVEPRQGREGLSPDRLLTAQRRRRGGSPSTRPTRSGRRARPCRQGDPERLRRQRLRCQQPR